MPGWFKMSLLKTGLASFGSAAGCWLNILLHKDYFRNWFLILFRNLCFEPRLIWYFLIVYFFHKYIPLIPIALGPSNNVWIFLSLIPIIPIQSYALPFSHTSFPQFLLLTWERVPAYPHVRLLSAGLGLTSRASLTVRITVKNGDPSGARKIWENRFFTWKMDTHGAKRIQIGEHTCQGRSRSGLELFHIHF